MGFFDWLKGKQIAGTLSPPAVAPAVAEPQASFVVPTGHSVSFYGFRVGTGLVHTNGGSCLAMLAESRDDLAVVADPLVDEVERLIRSPAPVSLVPLDVVSLSALCGVTPPSTRSTSATLLWGLNPGAISGAEQSAELVWRLLCCMSEAKLGSWSQSVHVIGQVTRRGSAVVSLMRGLGLDVRQPEAAGHMMVDVQRPDGLLVTSLLGAPLPGVSSEALAGLCRSSVQAAKEGEHQRADAARDLGMETIKGLLATVQGEAPVEPVWQAHRLRQLLLAMVEGQPSAPELLWKELLARKTPLLLMVDPQSGAVATREWTGGISGVPAFIDITSFRQCLADMGKAPSSIAMSAMSAQDLLAQVAQTRSMLAINVYRQVDDPQYVLVQPAEVAALAEGRMPGSSK